MIFGMVFLMVFVPLVVGLRASAYIIIHLHVYYVSECLHLCCKILRTSFKFHGRSRCNSILASNFAAICQALAKLEEFRILVQNKQKNKQANLASVRLFFPDYFRSSRGSQHPWYEVRTAAAGRIPPDPPGNSAF